MIKRLEDSTGSRMVVYFVGDRPIVGGVIADDAVRYMYDHIRSIREFPGPEQKLTLYLYSCGGSMEVPWKIVTMFRAHSREFDVMVPYKAYSAATMISLGADKIWMSKKAELGPIDPSLYPMANAGQPDKPGPFAFGELGTEDVSAYLRFLRDRAGLTDQDAIACMVQTLAQNITPVLLGKVERIYSHIRLVANKLLSEHQPPLDHQQIQRIIEALTEKSYVHGHSIGRKEAKEIGLDVADMNEEMEETAWSLYREYEDLLKLQGSADPQAFFTDDGPDLHCEEDAIVACIESRDKLHVFGGKLRIQRTRKVPPQPNINVNLGVTLPPTIDVAQIPDAVRDAVQQVIGQAAQQLRQLVQEELRRQSPVEGISRNLAGGAWREVRG
ncbi:MAG: hypothetical protein QME79_08585 [Bacillota bacterium]|nr:hypothetical protein [Bacillota bacterium]